ncbi:MAG: PAS-domain containing protein, partial [Gammaproteobacteria bacterium]|nr:PAS-domain containing protein [Gammaproteobacteria bacterium]
MNNRSPNAEQLHLRTGMDAVSEGVAVFDADELLVFCNESFRRHNSELVNFLQPGLPWSVFFKEASRKYNSIPLDRIDRHLQSGVESPLILEPYRRGERWIRVGIHLAEDGGFALTEADTTDQQLANEIIDQADSLLKDILDACASRIALVRIATGRLLYTTPAWHQMFGDEEHIQSFFADSFDYSEFLADLLSTGQVDDAVYTFNNQQQNTLPARLSARSIDYESEPAFVLSVEDMTQLYEQQEELVRRREAAFQNEKLNALGQLLAGVAHELNNPLSVVMGHAMMLRDEVSDEEAIKGIDTISKSAERCAKIVKTFLAMARQKPAQIELTDINELVSEALDIASYGLRKQKVTLELNLEDRLPAISVDRDQVTQVLINLMINAEHVLSDGIDSPCLRISTGQDVPKERVFIRVSDN